MSASGTVDDRTEELEDEGTVAEFDSIVRGNPSANLKWITNALPQRACPLAYAVTVCDPDR